MQNENHGADEPETKAFFYLNGEGLDKPQDIEAAPLIKIDDSEIERAFLEEQQVKRDEARKSTR